MNTNSPADLRKDAYENCLTIEFPANSGKLITYDDAGKMHANYLAIGDADIAGYLAAQMRAAKTKIRDMFPEEAE